ncbi:hypothetical protein GCM10027345_20360 [Hymenobacter daeguensis]
MKIILTRESVAMRDDADAPHQRGMTVADTTSLPAIIKVIRRSGYLASIAGGRATWTVVSRILLAAVAQPWAAPKLRMPVPE